MAIDAWFFDSRGPEDAYMLVVVRVYFLVCMCEAESGCGALGCISSSVGLRFRWCRISGSSRKLKDQFSRILFFQNPDSPKQVLALNLEPKVGRIPKV